MDCQCLNEFAEAATVTQTLRLAGKDNICSSGQKKPIPSTLLLVGSGLAALTGVRARRRAR